MIVPSSYTAVLTATFEDDRDREIVLTLDGDINMGQRKAEMVFKIFYPLQRIVGEIKIQIIK